MNGYSKALQYKWICFIPISNGFFLSTSQWICFNLRFQMDMFQSDKFMDLFQYIWIYFNPQRQMDLFQSDKIPWVSLNLIHIFIQYIHGSISTLTITQFYIIHGSLSTLNKKQFKIKSIQQQITILSGSIGSRPIGSTGHWPAITFLSFL